MESTSSRVFSLVLFLSSWWDGKNCGALLRGSYYVRGSESRRALKKHIPFTQKKRTVFLPCRAYEVKYNIKKRSYAPCSASKEHRGQAPWCTKVSVRLLYRLMHLLPRRGRKELRKSYCQVHWKDVQKITVIYNQWIGGAGSSVVRSGAGGQWLKPWMGSIKLLTLLSSPKEFLF